MKTITINLILLLILPALLYSQFTGGPGGGDISLKYDDSTLPVILASFTSNVNGRDIKLTWITSFESNNSGFEIERRISTGNWNKIAFIAGKGNVNTSTTYYFDDNNLRAGKYNYRLKQIDFNGNIKYHFLTDIALVGVPGKFKLSQNYPNPFNPITKIDYEIPLKGHVSIKIYNVLGKEIFTLVNKVKEAGYYSIKFDGLNLESGVYFYKINSENFSDTKRMVLIK